MNALIYKGREDLSYEKVDEPKLTSANWVKIQVSACGLCGSDIHKILFERPPTHYLKTAILGHEISGKILEIGKNVDNVSVGDIVCVEPLMPCGICELCRNGNTNLCTRNESVGRTHDGGFAEKLIVPAKNVWKLPSNVSIYEGTQIDLVAVAVHSLSKIKGNVENCRCAVIGDGPMALIIAQMVKILKPKEIILFAKKTFNQNIAKLLGIETQLIKEPLHQNNTFKEKFHVVFEAVGGHQNETISGGIALTAPTGTLVVLGVFDFTYSPSITIRDAFRKEINIIGVNSYCKTNKASNFETALTLVSNRQINVEQLITHKVGLSQYEEVISLIKSRKDRIKIIFDRF